MKNALQIVLFTFLLASCGGGAKTEALAPPVNTNPADELALALEGLALDDFFEESFKALMLRDPEWVISLALTNIYPIQGVELTNISDDFVRDNYAMCAVILDKLLSYDRDSFNENDKISYDVYRWYLQDRIDREQFFYHDFVASYGVFGIQRDTRMFFTDIHPLASRQDAEDYITRLGLIPRKFAQLADHLRSQRDAGIVEPIMTLNFAASQVNSEAQTPASSSPYFTAFRDKVAYIYGLSSSQRQSLVNDAFAAVQNSVIPAYRALYTTLDNLRSAASPSIGVGQFPAGPAYYSYVLGHHTTTDLTATQVHQLGLDELQRIHSEMRLIFDQLGYPQNETLQQLSDRLSADGGIIPAADVLATYEDLIDFADQNLDQAFDVFPAADVIVIAVPYGGYYLGPSFDGTRPGAFYAGTRLDEPYYRMPSVTFHETLPGHHLQVSLAGEANVPSFRRIIRATAFVEGWALYAERLAYELGWFDGDPYGNLGRLQWEAVRAVRLVVDTGIHYLGWSFDEAVQFMDDNVGFTTDSNQASVARYSVIPGQATAYMIGMLKILEARQRAMGELGSDFNLFDFHRTVLGNGGVPLPVLDQVVDAYVAEQLGTP
jgi:uncharacterized protein (DUF885 family)